MSECTAAPYLIYHQTISSSGGGGGGVGNGATAAEVEVVGEILIEGAFNRQLSSVLPIPTGGGDYDRTGPSPHPLFDRD